nr:BatA domain-containing protein [Planctomycetota bacterium]
MSLLPTLLSSGWMWALPLAAAPVVVHLAFRLRRRPLQLPSLMFFHRLSPRLHARRKLRDLLVLALRVALIAAAVVALAHPLWRIGGGSGAAAVVLLIDNSASMSAPADGRDDGADRLRVAIEAAGGLVAAFGSDDRAAVVTSVVDRSVPIADELVGDRARL